MTSLSVKTHNPSCICSGFSKPPLTQKWSERLRRNLWSAACKTPQHESGWVFLTGVNRRRLLWFPRLREIRLRKNTSVSAVKLLQESKLITKTPGKKILKEEERVKPTCWVSRFTADRLNSTQFGREDRCMMGMVCVRQVMTAADSFMFLMDANLNNRLKIHLLKADIVYLLLFFSGWNLLFDFLTLLTWWIWLKWILWDLQSVMLRHCVCS